MGLGSMISNAGKDFVHYSNPKTQWNILTSGGGAESKAETTLTPEQQTYLSTLIGQNTKQLPKTMSALSSLAYDPQSNYSKIGNWEDEFNTGVVNPALNQMNSSIANTMHSSNLHSSANRLAQDKVKQNTNDELAKLRYDQLMKERSMQIQGLDNAQANQISALGQLGNYSSNALGIQGIENIVSQKKSPLDYITALAPAAAAL